MLDTAQFLSGSLDTLDDDFEPRKNLETVRGEVPPINI